MILRGFTATENTLTENFPSKASTNHILKSNKIVNLQIEGSFILCIIKIKTGL